VNWRDPIAFRNRIVHGYFDVDDQLVFDAAKRDVPGLVADVKQVLKAEFPGFG
jgi:uncharacterized protein with HEPN domain